MTNNIVKSNPGNSKFFGTDWSGNLAFYDQSSLPWGGGWVDMVFINANNNTPISSGSTLNLWTFNHNLWSVPSYMLCWRTTNFFQENWVWTWWYNVWLWTYQASWWGWVPWEAFTAGWIAYFNDNTWSIWFWFVTIDNLTSTQFDIIANGAWGSVSIIESYQFIFTLFA